MSEQAQLGEPHSGSVLSFFAKNPLVGAIASIASIIGLPLALVLYFASLQGRDLVYAVYPNQTIIAQSGGPSGLRVEFKGEPIRENVIAMQFALWNQGKASIKREHILSALDARLTPGARILEATFIARSRAVTELSVSDDGAVFLEGRVPLSLRILERGDGGRLQIVYVAPREAKIAVFGTIEGQGEPRNLGSAATRGDFVKDKLAVLSMIVTAILVVVNGVVAVFGIRRGRSREGLFFGLMTLGLLGSLIVLAWQRWSSAVPPFAF